MTFEGACHCGGVKVAFETALAADAIEVRACQCTFCRRHGAKTLSDPNGKLTIHTARAHPYQFGLRISDFWICDDCGTFIAATAVIDGRTYGVLNVVGAAIAELAAREPKPMVYSAEDAEARTDRRRARWTPTEIVN